MGAQGYGGRSSGKVEGRGEGREGKRKYREVMGDGGGEESPSMRRVEWRESGGEGSRGQGPMDEKRDAVGEWGGRR